jgi:DNA-binding transcriptional MocR family regulator
MSTFINEMLEPAGDDTCAMTRHIVGKLIPAYARRHSLLTTAIKEHLSPLGVISPIEDKYHVAGGFFLWLRLPPTLTSAEVVAAARQDGVVIGDGAVSALPEGNSRCGTYGDMIRLCFAWVDEEQLVEGVRILRETIARLGGKV